MNQRRFGLNSGKRTFRVVVGLALVVAFCGAEHARAQEPPAETFHLRVEGAAVFSGSSCPFDDDQAPPEVDLVCEDWFVLFFKEFEPGDQRAAQWTVYLARVAVLVHPDGTFDILEETDGVTTDLEGSFDTRHLTAAAVHALVPMSDGSFREVDLAWDGTNSPRAVAGNHGPFSQANGIERHYVDRCVTRNFHSHQTYRANVEIAGSIDGTDVAAIPYVRTFDPFLSRAGFFEVEAGHGCAER